MPRYLALLRGINVGGRNKVAMADLRELAAGLGHGNVSTYIQSGNLLFSSARTDAGLLAGELEREIVSRLAVQPAVVVISAAELARVIADNPYPDETNPKALHAVFRQEEISPDGVAAVARAVQRAREAGSAEDAAIVGRTLFLRAPDGFGRSDLAAQLSRSAAQSGGTARNWATVTTLMSLLAATG